MRNLDQAAAFTASTDGDTHWVEHLRVEALSLGTYSIRAGGERVSVGPGSTLYVPAREVHRFVDVTSDLAVVVLFAPPESEG